MATSSTRAGGSSGCRRSSSRMQLMTRSSARVWAETPLAPALPNGVRTPSTNTPSRSVRGTGPPWAGRLVGLFAEYGRRVLGHGRAVDGLLEDGPGDVDLPLTGAEVVQGLCDGLQRRVGR